MKHGRGYVEDIPLEVRAYLYSITCSREAKRPLARVLQENGLGEHYQALWMKIQGQHNMTPSLLLTICQLYDDYTALEMLFAEYDLRISVEREQRVSGAVLSEVLEAVAAVGEVAAEFNSVINNPKYKRGDMAAVARRASDAISELRDVVNSIARGNEG